MSVLRARDAAFARAGAALVAPFSLLLDPGDTRVLEQPSDYAAAVAARMCAAIVKPTGGTIVVDEFETRLQPPQAKRLVGYVDRAGFAGGAHAFACELAFRAEAWGRPLADARVRADAVLGAVATAYGRALALALATAPALVVLDRAAPGELALVRGLAPGAAVLATVAAA